MGRRSGTTVAGTIDLALVLPAIRALEAHHLDPGPLLSSVGLPSNALQPPGDRVPYEPALALWERAAEAAGDPAFAIHAAEAIEPGELELVDYLFSTSPTLRDAFTRFAHYARLSVDGSTFRVETTDTYLKLVRPRRDASELRSRQLREFILAVLVQRGRDCTGVRWAPKRVAFAHSPHPARDEVDRFFGTKVEFGATAGQMWIDQDTASLPMAGADSRLSRVLLRYADTLLATAPRSSGLLELAHNAVAKELAAGRVSIAGAAARLGMSGRTLQRRLESLGTSHRELLDQTRFELAGAYLREPSTSVTSLAFVLGFSNVSGFTRAFKRWSGTSASVFREAHATDGPTEAGR
jgi:AraC-like DNA-binding protein